MDELSLKETLLNIKEHDFTLKDINKSKLTEAMLMHIGSSDPILRDELIYSCFVRLIFEDYYQTEELRQILERCIGPNHLFLELGTHDDDTVFTRSFSSLVIAAILHKNIEKPFLNTEDLLRVEDALILYIKKEKDLRGFVEEKGWAHSIAHVADAIDELVKQEMLADRTFEQIFLALNEKMTYDQVQFTAEEDERVATPVKSMLKNGLNQNFVKEQINKIKVDLIKNFPTGGPQYLTYRMNYKSFLRSLYFNIIIDDEFSDLSDFIKETLIEISSPYY